jgi:hypothetical protein
VTQGYGNRGLDGKLTRRDFLWLMSAADAGAASLNGSATDPITGKRVVVGLNPQQELSVHRNQSPFQFYADFGETQDRGLNIYIDDVGKKLGAVSHRPHMPYSFRVVNATTIIAPFRGAHNHERCLGRCGRYGGTMLNFAPTEHWPGPFDRGVGFSRSAKAN